MVDLGCFLALLVKTSVCFLRLSYYLHHLVITTPTSCPSIKILLGMWCGHWDHYSSSLWLNFTKPIKCLSLCTCRLIYGRVGMALLKLNGKKKSLSCPRLVHVRVAKPPTRSPDPHPGNKVVFVFTCKCTGEFFYFTYFEKQNQPLAIDQVTYR